MPTMSSIQNSVIGEGRKKNLFLFRKFNVKSLHSMAQRWIQCCCPQSKTRVRVSREESQTPSPFCWKAAPVKPHLFPGVTFQKDHRHRSSKKSNRAHQGLEGAAGEEGSWMCCFTGGALRPTQPPAGWKHQDGRNYLQTVGLHYGLKTLLNNRCNQHSRTIVLLHIPYQQALSSAEGNVLEHDNRIALSSTKSVEWIHPLHLPPPE